MENYNLFLVVLTFATLSGAVIVFLLERMMRYDERWLEKFKDVLGNPIILGQIFKKYNENINLLQGEKGKYVRRLNEEMKRYAEECGLTLDDGNSKGFISPAVWDNILDISTADIHRAKSILKRYIKGFNEVFGTSSYSAKFYTEILSRLQPKSNKLCIRIVVIFLVVLIAIISISCFATCYNLYNAGNGMIMLFIRALIKSKNLGYIWYIFTFNNMLLLEIIIVIFTSSLCIFLQGFLIKIAIGFSKPSKAKKRCIK